MENVRIHDKLISKEDKRKDIIVSILTIIVFSSLMSCSVVMFLSPLKLYGGGVTGIAQLTLHLIEVLSPNLEWDSLIKYLGVVNFIFLLPFDILAYIKLSKKYALYTFLSTIVQSIVMSFAEPLETIGIFANASSPTGYETVACVLFASIIQGVSNGMLMRRGGTSGGIIVLCQCINIKKGKSVGSINIFISSFIITCGGLLSFVTDPTSLGGAITVACYTLLVYVLESLIIDYVHQAYNKVKLEIITEKGKELVESLMVDFHHGITIQKGVGAYTGNSKDILNVVLQKSECNKYIDTIKKVDSNAFISIIPIWRFNGRFRIQIINK